MKKSIACFALFALVISLLSPVAVSAEQLPVWDASATEQMLEMNGRMSYNFLYQPKTGGKIAFIVPTSSGLHVKLMPENSNVSIPVARIFRNDYLYFVVDVTGGWTYTLNFLSVCDNGVATPVVTKSWNDSMFEYAPIGKNASQTISGTNSYSYLVKVPSDGIYTLTYTNDAALCAISAYPYYLDVSDPAEYPLQLKAKEEGNKTTICYYLSAKKTYNIEIMGIHSGVSNVCSYSITAGSPYGNAIGSLGSSPVTLTFDAGSSDVKNYVVQAPTAGKYMLLYPTGINAVMSSYNGNYIGGEAFGSIYSDQLGILYDFSDGQNCQIKLENTTSSPITGEFSFVKYTKINSVSIETVAYSQGKYTLLATTDPACGVMEDIQWSVSDPSVFSLVPNREVAEIQALKTGSAKVTVKVGDKTATMTLNSKPDSPTLKENITAICYPFNADSPAAYFKPTVTGTYQFTFDVRKNQFIRAIIARTDGTFVCDNRVDAKPVVTVELVAGEEYQIFLEDSVTDITIVRKSTANTPQNPTVSTPPPETSTPNTNTGNTQTQIQATQPSASPDNTDKNDSQSPDTSPVIDTTEPPVIETLPAEKVDVEIVGDSAVLTPDSIEQMLEKNPGQTIVVDVQKNEGIQSVVVNSNAWGAAYENNVPVAFKMNDGLTILFKESSVAGIYEKTMGADLEVKAENLDISQLNETQQKILNEYTVGAVVELSLSYNDQQIHELGGFAQVTIPCPDSTENWKVFYISEDGNMEEMTIVQQSKDAIVIETNHFSAFALVRDNTNVVDAQEGGSGWIVATIIVIVVLGGGAAAFFILKKKNLLPWFKSE